MAGTIPLELTQQLDEFGQPLSGGQLYIIQAGTVATPQNAYQDQALTIALPNPIVLDSAGRIPQFFLADGQIKVRLQDRYGVVKFVADNLLVIGPSSGGGGGGGGSVDPTTVLQTGDIKVRYDNSILTGFVRLNGNTIGSAVSGASELADPTAQNLFQYLWTADSTLAVSGGRGATAAADWSANKRLTLPDCRGRFLIGVDNMGGGATGLFSGVTFTKGSAAVIGSQAGAFSRAIPLAAMPAHRHNAYLTDPTHFHSMNAGTGLGAIASQVVGESSAAAVSPVTNSASTGITLSDGAGNVNLTTAAGSSGNMDMSNPFMMFTIYCKL